MVIADGRTKAAKVELASSSGDHLVGQPSGPCQNRVEPLGQSSTFCVINNSNQHSGSLVPVRAPCIAANSWRNPGVGEASVFLSGLRSSCSSNSVIVIAPLDAHLGACHCAANSTNLEFPYLKAGFSESHRTAACWGFHLAFFIQK